MSTTDIANPGGYASGDETGSQSREMCVLWSLTSIQAYS